MDITALQDTKNWRVLVVDDEPDNIAIMEAVLQLQNIEVATARSAKIAEGILDDFRPNLILLDIAMPDINGYGFLEILRARDDTANVPVIAVTANVVSNDKRKATKAGFDGYIAKPFDVFALVPTIQRILGFQTS
ncbi:MAG: response regulator [Chloroflexota bacterium]